MKIVMVEWEDARSDGGWQYKNDDLDISKCVTIGLLQYDKPNRVIIAQSKSDSGNWADRIAIPKCCIKRMRKLKVETATWMDNCGDASLRHPKYSRCLPLAH